MKTAYEMLIKENLNRNKPYLKPYNLTALLFTLWRRTQFFENLLVDTVIRCRKPLEIWSSSLGSEVPCFVDI